MHTSCDACLSSLLFLRRDMRLCVFWRTGRNSTSTSVIKSQHSSSARGDRPAARVPGPAAERGRVGLCVCVCVCGGGGGSCCLGFLLGAAVSKCDPPPLHITPLRTLPSPLRSHTETFFHIGRIRNTFT